MSIDTSLAAECAAKTIAAQAGRRPAHRSASNKAAAPVPYEVAPTAPKRQSALLRELREAVSKPAAHQLDNLFAGGGSQGAAHPFGARPPFGRRPAAERKFEPHAGHYGVPRRAAG
jgi:hypothetical protein